VLFGLAFLAWVACDVSFGSVLFVGQSHRTSVTDTEYFYHNRLESKGVVRFYSDIDDVHFKKCSANGKGFVFVEVMAFLLLLAFFGFVGLRCTGRMHWIPHPALADIDKAFTVEMTLGGFVFFFTFMGTLIFGSGCLAVLKDATSGAGEITATGYVFVVFGMLFALALPIVSFVIKRDPSLHLLSGGGRGVSSEGAADVAYEKVNSAGEYKPPTPATAAPAAPVESQHVNVVGAV